MPTRILAVVEDIFFLAKIQQTARTLDIAVEAVSPDELKDHLATAAPAAILLDLNHRSGKAVAVVQALKSDLATRSITVVAFLSHVQADLAQAAQAAGCDRVMARSAFSQQLPALLRELAKE
jgi:CheY-like chemotaxis protein